MDVIDAETRGGKINHKNCGHPRTGAGREKCRRQRGLLSPSQIEREGKQSREKAARAKAMAVAPPTPRTAPDNPHPKARYDKTGWRAESGLTAPRLAQIIHKRMKRDRRSHYVFTREWVAQQYPGTGSTMIDAALQYLVDTGKINTIPL